MSTVLGALNDHSLPYTGFSPLGGFNPVQSGTVDAVADRWDASANGATAWLLRRSPDIVVTPAPPK